LVERAVQGDERTEVSIAVCGHCGYGGEVLITGVGRDTVVLCGRCSRTFASRRVSSYFLPLRQESLPERVHAQETGSEEKMKRGTLTAAVHAANDADAEEERQERERMLAELKLIAHEGRNKQILAELEAIAGRKKHAGGRPALHADKPWEAMIDAALKAET